MLRTAIMMCVGVCWGMMSVAAGALELPAIFGDQMVLQRGKPVRVWGKAEPGQAVTVRLDTDSLESTADAEGRWRVDLPARPAGGPFELEVSAGQASRRYRDVMVGEVWLCSGQSNMERAILATDNPTQALPELRFIKVERGVADAPAFSFVGQWVRSTTRNARPITAVGYAFGEMLHEELGVPVGIIHSAYGGSQLHPWVRRSTLESDQTFAEFISRYKPKDTDLNRYDPQAHYNAMIAPIVPFSIGGVLWYQGESDAGRGQNYRHLLRALFADWRDIFEDPTLPFGVIQLAGYEHPGTRSNERVSWLEVRESQAYAADHDEHAGLIVTYDVGERYDIHPNDKRTVGRRAAAWALADVYGKNMPWQGPRFASWEQQGTRVTVRFDHVTGELRPRSGEKVFGFGLLYANGQIRWGIGQAQGDTVVIDQALEGVEAIRYAYENAPLDANLTDASGLPARPFRTDSGPLPHDGSW